MQIPRTEKDDPLWFYDLRKTSHLFVRHVLWSLLRTGLCDGYYRKYMPGPLKEVEFWSVVTSGWVRIMRMLS